MQAQANSQVQHRHNLRRRPAAYGISRIFDPTVVQGSVVLAAGDRSLRLTSALHHKPDPILKRNVYRQPHVVNRKRQVDANAGIAK